MSLEDRWIIIGLVIVILVHFAALIIGHYANKLSYLISILNLAIALSILAYWIINEIQVQQHAIELREIVVLIFEVIVAVSALYNIISANYNKPLRILQHIFFGVDLIVLITALIFMLTFKITKLF